MGYIEVCPVDVKVKEEKTEDIPVADESVDDLLSGTPEPKIEDVPF